MFVKNRKTWMKRIKMKNVFFPLRMNHKNRVKRDGANAHHCIELSFDRELNDETRHFHDVQLALSPSFIRCLSHSLFISACIFMCDSIRSFESVVLVLDCAMRSACWIDNFENGKSGISTSDYNMVSRRNFHSPWVSASKRFSLARTASIVA